MELKNALNTQVHAAIGDDLDRRSDTAVLPRSQGLDLTVLA
jgi:hypothetical protein